jgi:hypothetical protein
MPEPITLPRHCPHCGGAVEVQFADWADNAKATPQTWPCPYCQCENSGSFPGRLLWACQPSKSDVDVSHDAMLTRLSTKKRH